MLQGKDAAATIAVSDLDRAREFYENTLGLSAIYEDAGGVLYKSGNSAILVYPSEFAGTQQGDRGDMGRRRRLRRGRRRARRGGYDVRALRPAGHDARG